MKKATQKSAPASLGTKRTCPDCSTKFYDFGKSEIVCPKCESKLDPEALNPLAAYKAEPKRTSRADKEVEAVTAQSDDLVVGESEDMIESVDDLEDDEEDVVEDLDVDDDDSDDEEY